MIFLLLLNLVCIVPLAAFFVSLSFGVTTGEVTMSLGYLRVILGKIIIFLLIMAALNRLFLFVYKLNTKQIRNPFKRRKTIGEEMNEK